MPDRRVYLDANATTPLRTEAWGGMLAAFDVFGNPSSVHAEGRRARGLIEDAREVVAALFDARPRDIIFTSGATEAAALALAPPEGDAGTRLILGAGEHPAVRLGHRFRAERIETAPLTGDGILDLAALADCVARPGGPPWLALQAANNETGAIQPVAEAAAIIHAAGGRLICDAVQAAGRIDCRLETLGADVAFVSGHKLGGPKGVGAVAVRPGLTLTPLMRGGGQERGARAGTENVAAIAGFSWAVGTALAAREKEQMSLRAMRDAFEAGLRALAPDVTIFAERAARLANTSCFAMPGTEAATLVIALDLAGFAVSSGAACSSGKVTPSAVLAAMGVAPALARGALRVSFGWTNVDRDGPELLAALGEALRRRGAKPSPPQPARA